MGLRACVDWAADEILINSLEGMLSWVKWVRESDTHP